MNSFHFFSSMDSSTAIALCNLSFFQDWVTPSAEHHQGIFVYAGQSDSQFNSLLSNNGEGALPLF